MQPVSVSDYRLLAQKRLPHFLFEYLDGGAFSETTLRNNRLDLEQIALKQRVLMGVDAPDLTTTLFGQPFRLPVALGPIGLAGLNSRRGECQAARAAAKAGVPFTLSTVSACSLGEVVAASPGPIWFQLYMTKDRGFMRDMLSLAQAQGCSALIFTVDMPVPGIRYRDYRSGLTGAPGIRGATRRFLQAAARPKWAWDVGVRGRPHQLGNVAQVLGARATVEDFFGWARENFDPSISWRDLDAVRSAWTGPLIIKGVLDADDGRRAADMGADGVVVSNHGGRQLDGAVSTVRALPAVVDAIGDRLAVLADGGVRSGADVIRLLALGAKGVLLGRAWAYALAGGGERGVSHVLALIEAEMRVLMTLTGARTLAEVNRDILADTHQ